MKSHQHYIDTYGEEKGELIWLLLYMKDCAIKNGTGPSEDLKARIKKFYQENDDLEAGCIAA